MEHQADSDMTQIEDRAEATHFKTPHAIVVMGVSGCGKSSIGERLAARFHLQFLEGDSLHPQSNVEKMAKGTPLTDEDRWPWLETIGTHMRQSLEQGQSIVISCSSLKKTYRDLLRRATNGNTIFIYLDGSEALLSARMSQRSGHFMPVALLQSQLATLEVPSGEDKVITVSIDQSLDAIVEEAERALIKQFQ